MKKLFVVVLIVAAGWHFHQSPGSVTLGPGVMAAEAPIQKRGKGSVQYSFRDYTLTEQARFDIKAKVLGRKDYTFGREAELSPIDLALGWGRMSDESVLDKIAISQSGRFYRWQVETFPIPRREIETHSANMHLIPANEAVRDSINRVRQGDIVKLSGSLVNVASNTDNWYWRSSLTREDTGNGACELILVKQFDILTL